MLDTRHLAELITSDPEIVSGTPVFAGTRVPIRNLFDYLEGGHEMATVRWMGWSSTKNGRLLDLA
jgi:uncharacterized protein (DUF433 family)